MATMRAWVFTATGAPMRLEAAPAPGAGDQLPPGSALVRISAATICGSDVHTIDGKRTDPAAPLVLGHEGVGEVVLLGAGAAPGGVALGERVTWSVAASECGGACEPCARWSLPQKCSRLKKYGHFGWGAAPTGRGGGVEGFAGTYASHVLLTAGSCVVRLPAGLPDAVAAPANCALATMVNAVTHSALLRGGGVAAALVQGAGMLGLYGVALLKHGGGDGARAPFVAVTDVSPARLALARRFGADVAVDVTGKDDAAVAAELASALAAAAADAAAGAPAAASAAPSPAGFDLVLEVCGSSAVVPLALRALRPGGEIVFVGQVHPGTPLAGVTGDAVIRRCATIRGVHNYTPADLAAGVSFLARTAGLPYAELVSAPYALDELPAAVELARSGQFARVLVTP